MVFRPKDSPVEINSPCRFLFKFWSINLQTDLKEFFRPKFYLLVRVITGSVFFSGCSGWVVVSASDSCWVSMSELFASAEGVKSSFPWSVFAEDWFIFVLLRFAVAEVAIYLSLCSARKHSRDCFWHPQIAATPVGVGNLAPRWYIDGTACMALSHGDPMITL